MQDNEIIFGQEVGEKPLSRFTFYGGNDLGPDPSFIVDGGYEESVYRIEDDKITIRDAVWGDMIIGNEAGDEVFLELVNHPLIRRLQAIEQLTLPQYMTTIAGTSGFSRWEHVWGSLVLTRKLSKGLDMTSEEARKMELRSLLSDSAHWAFSHLGDWILQGAGGTEDEHDDHQLELIRKTGVDTLLTDFGYNAGDLLVKGGHDDWVECSAPDLNVDRVDYGTREILRWLQIGMDTNQSIKNFPFKISDEGQLVITNIDFAKQFTRGFLLLSTEHWSEPVHRLQLKLLEEMVKHSVTHYEPRAMQPLVGWRPYHPRDVLMSIDYDFEASMHTSNPFLWATKDIANRIGHERRVVFRSTRASYLAEFVRGSVPLNYPDPMETYGWHQGRHSLFPSNVEIVEVDRAEDLEDFGGNPYTVDFHLPPLKHRFIDPIIETPEGLVRLSEYDESFAKMITKHKQIFARQYVARVALNPEFKNTIEAGITENKKHWAEHLDYERMSDDEFRESFEHVSVLAVAMRKAHIEWWR